MPKIVYKLTTDINDKPKKDYEYRVNATIVDGKVEIVVEYEDNDEDLLISADASGERQADMLWEIFDHDFSVYDEDGNEATYED